MEPLIFSFWLPVRHDKVTLNGNVFNERFGNTTIFWIEKELLGKEGSQCQITIDPPFKMDRDVICDEVLKIAARMYNAK